MSGPKLSAYEIAMRAEYQRQLQEKLRAGTLIEASEKVAAQLQEMCLLAEKEHIPAEKLKSLRASILGLKEELKAFTEKTLRKDENCDDFTMRWNALQSKLNNERRIFQLGVEQNNRARRLRGGDASALERSEQHRRKVEQNVALETVTVDEQQYASQAAEMVEELRTEISEWGQEDEAFAQKAMDKLQIIEKDYRSRPRTQMDLLASFIRSYRQAWQQHLQENSVKPTEVPAEATNENETLNATYQMLCSLLRIQPEPLSPNQMAAECEEMQKRLVDEQCRNYTAEAVRECMKEMGYTLLAGQQAGDVEQHVYQVHDDTVLQVRMNSSGQILMEVGRADLSDRDVRIGEVNELVGDMKEFCSNHARIVEKLSKKGVYLEKLIYDKPTAENAKIINLSAYEPEEQPISKPKKQPAETNSRRKEYLQNDGGKKVWR